MLLLCIEVMQLQHVEELGYFNCHLRVRATMNTAATDNNGTHAGLSPENATVRSDPGHNTSTFAAKGAGPTFAHCEK